MKRTLLSALLVTLCMALPAWPQTTVTSPVANDTVVLRVGDTALTKAEYEKLVLGFDKPSGAVTTGGDVRMPQTGKDVARLLALVSEAQRRKLDQDPKISALIRVRGYVLLSNALLAAVTDDVKKDEAGTRALWNSEKNNYVEIRARQILLRYKGVHTDGAGAATTKGTTRTEAQAKAQAAALYTKLTAGASFESVAKTSSDDQATSGNGGELPAFARGALAPQFEAVAFALPVGKVSAPFKTNYGYHIIEVIEQRPFPFAKVRSALEYIRAKQKVDEIASSAAQLDTAYFKP